MAKINWSFNNFDNEITLQELNDINMDIFHSTNAYNNFVIHMND